MLLPPPPNFLSLPLPIAQLSLSAVLKCGQSFRWHILPLSSSNDSPFTHEFRFCLRDRVVCLRQSPDKLFYRSVFPEPPLTDSELITKEGETLAWLKDYFQLNVDLIQLYDEWSNRDIVFNRLRNRFAGIRILRQDPWETLISFICSSNNNIGRIGKMVQAMCSHYSPPLIELCDPSSEERRTYHPFPPPSSLATPEVAVTLRSLGFGYRAEFIQRTARMLVDDNGSVSASLSDPSEQWLLGLRAMKTSEAREELLKFIGVGRKVADCILLMSLDKKEVVPVDTHVHQIASKYYHVRGSSGSKLKVNMTPQLYNEVSEKLAEVWGEYAGWAHSVLFTADLKAFSNYGLSTPTPEAPPEPLTFGTTPGSSPRKRARRPESPAMKVTTANAGGGAKFQPCSPALEDEGTLCERVKRRRSTRVR